MLWELGFVARRPLLGPLVLADARALRLSDRWSRNELESFQARKLSRLLRVVESRVPVLRELYAHAGADLGGGGRELRIEALPVLTKQRIREWGCSFAASGLSFGPRRVSWTGGSTGEPLRVTKNLASVAMGEASLLRFRRWHGIGLGVRGAIVKSVGRATRLGGLGLRLERTVSLGAFQSGLDGWRAVARRLQAWAPDYVTGYPSTLGELAEACDGMSIGPCTVVATGETMLPEQRERLQRVFGGRVIQYYGSNEVTGVAFECEQGRLHVNEEHVILEVIDEMGRPVLGEHGRVVVTDLDNDAMPFVRYELGDLATLSTDPCDCGRSSRVLASLEGRVQDRLIGPDGKVLSAIFFAARFRGLRRVKRYQIEQLAPTRIVLRYVGDSPEARGEVEQVAAEIGERLGSVVAVEIVRVEEIPLSARGKRRLVIGLAA